MRARSIVVAAVAVAAAAAGVGLVSCAGPQTAPEWQRAQARRNEITALWTQIRDWRREAHMDVEPAQDAVVAMRGVSARAAGAVCPSAPESTACSEVCDLADAICENMESICDIAAQLGDDAWAKEKCDSAKASCKEAKERCCTCGRDAHE